jgi:hypothetical protein
MEAMLTENQIQRIARLVRLAEYMTPELREGLAKLIRDLKVAEGEGVMPQSAIQPMVDAVGDQQMADIVADLRSAGRTEPRWMAPSPARKPEEKGSGPLNPVPLEPPSGIRYVDEIAEAFAALDRRDLEKRLRGD